MSFSPSPAWIREEEAGVTLLVSVQPGARRSEVVGEKAGRLKIKIAAPAVDGSANKALVKFLSDRLAIRSRQVELRKGERSRQKVLHLEGISRNAVLQQLDS